MQIPPIPGMTARKLLEDLRRLAATFAVALAAGYALLLLGAPAPILLGSLFGVWLAGGAVRPLRAHLGVARWFHAPVVLGLGVLIGSYFSIDFIDRASQWGATIAAMILVTVLVTALGYWHLRRLRGYSRPMAFLCAIPGGQIEAIAVAHDLVDRDFVVALFHLVRVALVFFATPLILGYLQGAEAVAASNAALGAMPGILDMEPGQFAGLLLTALCGLLLARAVRLPVPHLLGPMLLSSALHVAGVLDIPRIQELVWLAQLAIGGAIGARLARVRFMELLEYIKTAVANTLMIVAVYVLAAEAMAYLLGIDPLLLWLAFVPGGLYEVTLLALIFGFDIAFVAFHHTTRILLIIFSLPFLAMREKRGGG